MRISKQTTIIGATLAVFVASCVLSATVFGPGFGRSKAAPPTATSSASRSASGPASTSGSDRSTVTVIIAVRGGRVQSGLDAVEVKAGQQVKVVATSDVADSIHVHGYDKSVKLEPDQPASVSFIADVKGSFDIETHESGLLVGRLIVT